MQNRQTTLYMKKTQKRNVLLCRKEQCSVYDVGQSVYFRFNQKNIHHKFILIALGSFTMKRAQTILQNENSTY